VATQHILAIVAMLFLLFALARIFRNAGRIDSASRTWLLITVIFTAVSAWLFFST
jgi:hypothetical protein